MKHWIPSLVLSLFVLSPLIGQTAAMVATTAAATTVTETGVVGQAPAVNLPSVPEGFDLVVDTEGNTKSVPQMSGTEAIFQALLPPGTVPLRQYGYDLFSDKDRVVSANVSPQYVLGVGDQLTVLLWGDPVDLAELPPVIPAEVNRGGGLFFAPVGLVPVAGQTLQDVEKVMTSLLARKYKRFELRLSLSQLRQFPVTVSGFVNKPGLVRISAGSSLLDALTAAGGVSKNGTLRAITVRSSDGRERVFDLYDLLIGGKPNEVALREGDSLSVPALGIVAGIWGGVQRPGLYELKPGDRPETLLTLAGGYTSDGLPDTLRVSRITKGQVLVEQTAWSQPSFSASPVATGTLVEVGKGTLDIQNGAFASGAISFGGWFSLQTAPTLATLVPQVGLKLDTNLHYAELTRITAGGARDYLTFSPLDALKGVDARPLFPGDRIRLFARGDVKTIDPSVFRDSVQLTGYLRLPEVYKYSEKLSLVALLKAAEFYPDTDMGLAQVYRSHPQTAEQSVLSFSPQRVLAGDEPFVLQARDRIRFFQRDDSDAVAVTGEVKYPLTLPFSEGLTLDSVLALVGVKGDPRHLKVQIRWSVVSTDSGVTATRQDQMTEVYLRDRYLKGTLPLLVLKPGSSVVVKPLGPTDRQPLVYLTGEVARPGAYPFVEGQRLSQLVEQAGGFTDQAFYRGLVFTRASIIASQRVQATKTLQTLQEEISTLEAQAAAMTDPLAKAAVVAQLAAKKQALELVEDQLNMTLGRISLSVPSSWKAFVGTPRDLLLEDGDRIYIPTVPKYVTVLGSVFNQGTQAYVDGKTVGEALNLAGNATQNGDIGQAYLVRSNGLVESSAAHQFFFWSTFGGLRMEPGDAVVVPAKDPNQVDSWAVVKESLTILGTSIGITANSLAIMQSLGVLK